MHVRMCVRMHMRVRVHVRKCARTRDREGPSTHECMRVRMCMHVRCMCAWVIACARVHVRASDIARPRAPVSVCAHACA